MAEELRKLGGEIDTQFVYRPDETSMVAAEAAVRADQEAVCGYKLIMLRQRTMELADEKGRYVEVFVTYGPYPAPETPLNPPPPSMPQVQAQPMDGTVVMTPLSPGTKVVFPE